MKNIWLFEKNLFPEYEIKLVESIKNSGSICYLLNETDNLFDFDKYIKNKYDEKDCVII